MVRPSSLQFLFVVLSLQAYFVQGAFIGSTRSQQQIYNPSTSFLPVATSLSTSETEVSQAPGLHVVEGVQFREIPMDLPVVGTVTILEATSEAQEKLVDMALLEEEDDGLEDSLIAAGDPYGAVLWPAAWAVAKYLVAPPSELTAAETEKSSPLEGISILELGTGTGLISIATALAGAKVLATDYEPLALTLTQYAAKKLHGLTIETQHLDLCDTNTSLPYADIVVAADVLYEPKTGRAMAHRVVEALRQNSRVIVGDSPGRVGRPAFLETLKELGLEKVAKFEDTVGRTCSGPRHDLICGKNSPSVSETPKDLAVAIMDLDPSMLPSALSG